MASKYFVVCPNCGAKLITVCSGENSEASCPQCSQAFPAELYVEERNSDDALKVIAANAELSENFAETVKSQIESDEEVPRKVGSQLAKAINSNSVDDALMALTGWSIDSLLDMTPPVLTDSLDGFVDFTGLECMISEYTYSIVEVFENYLESLNIRIPCKDSDEEEDRAGEDNDTALFGSEYWEIVDDIEAWLNNSPNKAGELSNYFIEVINRFLDAKGFGEYKPNQEQSDKIKNEVDLILKA